MQIDKCIRCYFIEIPIVIALHRNIKYGLSTENPTFCSFFFIGHCFHLNEFYLETKPKKIPSFSMCNWEWRIFNVSWISCNDIHFALFRVGFNPSHKLLKTHWFWSAIDNGDILRDDAYLQTPHDKVKLNAVYWRLRFYSLWWNTRNFIIFSFWFLKKKKKKI